MIGRLARRYAPVWRTGLVTAGGYAGIAGLLLACAWLARAFGHPEIASRLPWYLSRAAGITAYLLLTATTVLGLAIATRIADRWLTRPVLFALHEHLAWLGLTAVGLHVGELLADSYLPFGVADLLVPFAAPYRPAAVALGVVAFYLSVVITSSFYVRTRIGHRTWRTLHTASFGAYALATAHGILAGSSTAQPWMQWLYLGSGAAVLLLANYWLLLAKRTRQRPPQTAERPSRVFADTQSTTVGGAGR